MRELIAEKPFSNEFIPYYYQIANHLRAAVRDGYGAGGRYIYCGFRVARTLAP